MPSPKFNKEQFLKAIENSKTIKEVLLKLNITFRGGAYISFYRAAKRFDVDISKFNPRTHKEKEKISDKEFIEAVKTSFSKAEVIRKVNSEWSYRDFNNYIKKLNVNTSHFTGQAHLKGKTHNWGNKNILEEVLITNNTNYTSSALRKRLIKENILENKCFECGLVEWNGKEISLHLDHIDGNNTNNLIINLRILCPNCHSQTDTYCGRNKGKYK